MNPKDSPHNSKRQANQNLDDSQSSSVSIKIFNKNDDNVVIRLYRNKTRTNRDKFKNSRGHLRQAAGRSEGKDKRKPTMFRNLYRNTFGPTIDETVLVGMETFQICQQDCQGQSCSAPDNSNDTCVANNANELQEDCRKTGSIIPNELSWDCSTLLPTSTNEKNFESVCTNTSNCMLNKEMNLSPLVTNQYQYSPCLAKSQTETGCPYSPPTQTNGSSEEPNPLNNVSSDENLSKHISSEGINASYKTDITRSTITDSKHDTNKTLASISTYSGTKDPANLVSDFDFQKSSSTYGQISSSETRIIYPKDITKKSYVSNKPKLVGSEIIEPKTVEPNMIEPKMVLPKMVDVPIQMVEFISSSSYSENCLLCQESIKEIVSSKSEDCSTDSEKLFASNLLPKDNTPKMKQFLEETFNFEMNPSSEIFPKYLQNISYNKCNFQKLRKSKTDPDLSLVKPVASLLSNLRARGKNKSNTGSTAFTSTFVKSSISKSTSPSQILIVVPNISATEFFKLKKRNLKVVDFREIPEWEKQKSYPTARFIRGKIQKKSPLKKIRLVAGSDRRDNLLYSSCSTSSWMTQYSLRSNIKNIPSHKAREMFKDLQKIDTRPVLKVKHVLSTSSSSNFSTSSTMSSSICCASADFFTNTRQRSGTNSTDNHNDIILMHEKLSPMEQIANDNKRPSGKERLNNSDILLPPNESYRESSNNTRPSTVNSPQVQRKRTIKTYKNPTSNSRQSSAYTGRANVQNAQMVFETMRGGSKNGTNTSKDINSSSYGRPKGEYCKATGIIYTSDPSSAGICPNLKRVDKLWDYKERDRAKRKPILEKLVDVLSDYSKRSSMTRNPTYCKTSTQDRKVPRRTPILQKLFNVFSKKNVQYPPSIPYLNVNFEDSIPYEGKKNIFLNRNFDENLTLAPKSQVDFEKSSRVTESMKSDKHILDEKRDYFDRHTSLAPSSMEEKYIELIKRNPEESEEVDEFEEIEEYKGRGKVRQTREYSKINQFTETETRNSAKFEETRPEEIRKPYIEMKKPDEKRRKCCNCQMIHQYTETDDDTEIKKPTVEIEEIQPEEIRKQNIEIKKLEEILERKKCCNCPKLPLEEMIHQCTETDDNTETETQTAGLEETKPEEIRKENIEMKKPDEIQERGKSCNCKELKHQYTETNNNTSTKPKEERRACNKHTCETRRINAEKKQQWDETEKRQQWDEPEKRRNSSNSQPKANQTDFKESKKGCICEAKKSSPLDGIKNKEICLCNKETQLDLLDNINEAQCCKCKNPSTIIPPDPKSLSLSSSSPQATFRSIEVHKKKSKRAAASGQKKNPSKTILEPKKHKGKNLMISVGSRKTSKIKLKTKKTRNVVTFHVSTISQGDVFGKKRKASSKKIRNRLDEGYNNNEEEEYKETENREKLNNILQRGIQMNINDCPTKCAKPLMWRSFRGNEHFKDVTSSRKPICKEEIPKTTNAEQQSQKLQKCLCRKCSICSKESGLDVEEVKEQLNICAFRDCSQELFKIQKAKRREKLSSEARVAGGCEHNACDTSQTVLKSILLNENLSYFVPEMDLSDHEVCNDYPTYPNQRKSRQFSASAQSEESRLRRCRCEIEQISRNNIPQETRYAITRVTKYDDYTTYEILKSTRAKPKKIPEILEKIFIEKDI